MSSRRYNLVTPRPAIEYKRSYNESMGLPEPKWGPKVNSIQCPNCGSQDMYLSASPDSPEEIIGYDTVRCKHCGAITDWYEAHKQRVNHPTDVPSEVTEKLS